MIFFFNDTATTEIYTLSLHDALPIFDRVQDAVLGGMGLIALHSAHYSKVFRRLLGTSCSLSWRNEGDRKSTRLNSSHANISYAVFCLKKKILHPFIS